MAPSRDSRKYSLVDRMFKAEGQKLETFMQADMQYRLRFEWRITIILFGLSPLMPRLFRVLPIDDTVPTIKNNSPAFLAIYKLSIRNLSGLSDVIREKEANDGGEEGKEPFDLALSDIDAPDNAYTAVCKLIADHLAITDIFIGDIQRDLGRQMASFKIFDSLSAWEKQRKFETTVITDDGIGRLYRFKG
ncbi:hypothetical protein E4T43_09449 [Aureobasidium subglaciale]|nr:hypothetical protein E4T43_09449 [Aureobasidium subglaciale]